MEPGIGSLSSATWGSTFNLRSDRTSLHALTNFDKQLVGGFQT